MPFPDSPVIYLFIGRSVSSSAKSEEHAPKTSDNDRNPREPVTSLLCLMVKSLVCFFVFLTMHASNITPQATRCLFPTVPLLIYLFIPRSVSSAKIEEHAPKTSENVAAAAASILRKVRHCFPIRRNSLSTHPLIRTPFRSQQPNPRKMCRANRPSRTITIDVPSNLRPPRAAFAFGRQHRPEPRPLPPVPVEQQEELDRLRLQIDRSLTLPLNESREERPLNDSVSVSTSSTQPPEASTRRSGRRLNRRSLTGPVSVESHLIFHSTWIVDVGQTLSFNPSRSPHDRNYRRNIVTSELTPIRRGRRMSNLVGPDMSA